MKRRLVLVFGMLLFAIGAMSQPYGNEWIDFNKNYFKVTLSQNGIYRISYADLQSAGFPVNSVDPRRIQLFHKGVEQAIFVNGQGDAVFNTSDYIEFYGKRNDGSSETRLFQPEEAQPHTLYSIYTDSSAYFLTYNLSTSNGKRMSSYSENNTGGLPAQSAHLEENRLINNAVYAPGQGYSTDDLTRYTQFDYGEGWTSIAIQEGDIADFTISGISNPNTPAGNPKIEVLLVGRDDVAHSISVSIGPSTASLRTLGTVQFDNYESFLFSSDILWTDISGSGSLVIRISALGVAGGNDNMSTSYIRVFYPQNYDMTGLNSKLFTIPTQASTKSYIEISGTPASTQFYDVTDADNVIRIGSNTISGGHSAIINGTLSERKIMVNGASFITPVLRKANFRIIDPNDHDYIVITNKFLMTPAGGLSNPVKSYAGYRASTAGGSYDTLVVDIDMLYNQFNYGIVNPLAIYDFMRFMIDGGDPQYLFIIGKGLEPKVDFHRNASGVINVTQTTGSYELRDLVPSAGAPASDIAFTAGLDGTTHEAAVPVGRLPSRSPIHVVNYLNKIIEMESTPFDELWRKNILHLSGGITSSELAAFKFFMNGFEATAEDVFLGGKVETLAKTSGSTVELINVADEVNSGLNLVTFFGHSAPNITDIDIGFVTDPLLGYSNSGRYPSFLVNGCNAGNFFSASVSFGEDWILAEDKGAMSFIAHSSYGFSNSLKLYSDLFYETAYGDSIYISKSIAEVQKEVGRKFIDLAGVAPNNVTIIQQMNLLGDPAYKLFGPELPDYAITENDISVESFSEEPLTALSDSFAVKIIVRNYGRTRNDSINVQINRTLPNSAILTYDSLFAPVKYVDTLIFKIKRGEENGFGNNTFSIQIDNIFAIPELDETNNSISVDAFIQLFGTLNLYPLNYSIVSTPTVNLKVQSTDILEGVRDFQIQIDTTENFNSPFLKSNVVNAKLLATWGVDLLSNISVNDSTVYYWRSKFANIQTGESDEWVVSSFIFINNGPEGWSQNESGQFINNTIFGLELNEFTGKYEFLKTPRKVEITTFGGDNPAIPADVSVQIDDIEYIIDNQKRCRDNTINLIAFDKNEAIPYAAVPLNFQDVKTCGRQPQVINSFTFTELETGTSDLIEYVNNVADGDSVVFFTFGNPQTQSWSANVLSKLEELGASSASISALQNGEPYIVFGKKGSASGTATEYTTSTVPETEQELNASLNFTGVASSGNLTSTIIGPATSWNNVFTSSISQVNDQVTFDVIGMEQNRSETTIMSNQVSSPLDISSIDAIQYPYLKLKLKIADVIDLTPAQLNRWQVNYIPAAEGILLAESPNTDDLTIQEGAPLTRSFKFLNISNQLFSDSLVVKQDIFNRDTRQTASTTFNIAAPEPNDTTTFSSSIITRGITGSNDYKLTVNPRVLPEQYYDNNLLDLRNNLNVNGDDINPLLDVLFDGRYIINGDIVSPTPNISIRLKDENPYLLVTDTTALDIFIKRECENCNFQRVAYSSPNITWNSASDNEDFKIEYRPNKLEDGIYTLRIDARDESGNLSGEEPYLISFEVINESTITNFYPYPNPFSTSTRFVFTLTGSEIPNEIIIQIMTVTGKVVREITQDEIGQLYVGNNLTNYAWDGRDEFGDQLANGVYLYRVFVKQSGNTLKQRSTSADKAFKNGFGKLYILR